MNLTMMDCVWADIETRPNVEVCFTCHMERYADATLELVARDLYNLYINGRFVSYGPSRGPKGYSRMERINIAPYLTSANNHIRIYVQSNYTNALCFAKEKPLFGARIWGGSRLVRRTEDFLCHLMMDKLSRVERMSCQRGFLEVYDMRTDRLHTAQEQFSALNTRPVECPKLLDRGVAYAENRIVSAARIKHGRAYTDSTAVWANDFTRQLDTGERLSAFRRDECDCLLSMELLRFRYTEEEPSYLNYQIFALDKVRCGKFCIKLNANENAQVWLTYDDILTDGYVKFNREHIIHGMKWTLEKGSYTLYSQEVYSAQYIQIITQGAVEISEVSVICIENPDAMRFVIPPLEPKLRTIVDAARNTFAQNAYDLFTDCPSRERAGYLCDSYFSGKTEQFFTGENKVEKNFLENYLLYEGGYFKHNGIMPMCYPSEASTQESYIPNWILWYVLELEDYQSRTGDAAFIAKHTRRIRDILDFFKGYENEYGLLEDLEGWVFVEWSRATDFVDGVNFPSNMLYAEGLRAAGVLLEDRSLIEKSEKLKERIVRMSYNGTVFIDNAVRVDGKLKLTENVSELCQIFAQYFRLVPEDKGFFQNFKNRFHQCGYEVCPTALFIGGILRLMCLYNMGEYRLVLEESKALYYSMAKCTGTIWEFYNENASCNHGFGSIIGKLICESAAYLQERGEYTVEAS